MDLPLTEQDIGRAVQFDFRALLRVEEHSITELNAAHAGAQGDDLGPGQSPTAQLGGGRNDDAGAGPTLTLGVRSDQDAVMKHPDRQFGAASFGHLSTVPAAPTLAGPHRTGDLCGWR